MEPEPNVEATEEELEYRTKHYHDLRALKQRELSCVSCGNVLSHDSAEIYSHPIFGILQCRKCNDRVKNTLDSDDASTSCSICTIPRKNLYKCNRKNCSYKFCQACIKRNAPQSLTEADSKKWKCFACNSKPLWKLRGVCVAVINSNLKRTKRKKVSRNSSSDTDDEKSDLRNISYVRRRQLTDAKKLSDRLSTFCDEDSSTQTSVPLRFGINENKKRTKQEQLETNKKFENYFGCGIASSGHSTSSDDSDVQEIKTLRDKINSKSKSKIEDSRNDKSRDKQISANTRETGSKFSMSSFKLSSSHSDRSNDDSDIEICKRASKFIKRKSKDKKEVSDDDKMFLSSCSDGSNDGSDIEIRERASKFIKRKSKDRDKVSNAGKTLSNDKDSDDDRKVSRKKSRKSSTSVRTSSRGKSVKFTREEKKSPKSIDHIELDDSDSESPTEKRKSSKSVSKKSAKVTKDGNKSWRTSDPMEEDDSDSDSSRDIRKSSKNVAKKSIKLTKTEKKLSKDSDSIEKTNDDLEHKNQKETRKGSRIRKTSTTSKENGELKKSTRGDDRMKKSTRVHDGTKKLRNDKSPSENNDDSDESVTQQRQLRNNDVSSDENKVTKRKSKKSFAHRQLKIHRTTSDSSSGKEFAKGKLFRNSYVSLKRISVLEQDYTKTPDKSPEKPMDFLSNDQTFALKNSVTNFFTELKKAANKLVNDIEHAQTTYCMKKSMRPVEVERLILETKEVVTKLKSSVDCGENKMDDYYDRWCKKTRVKNVLRTKRQSIDNEKPSSSSKHNAKESPDNDKDLENDVTVSPVKSPNTNGTEKRPAVFIDYNSDEIFSNDETGKSEKNSKSVSPNRKTSRAELPELTDDKTSRSKNNISSDEIADSDNEPKDNDVTALKNKQSEKSKRSSPCAKLSSIDEDESEDNAHLEKSISPNNLETNRESLDPSDVDIFETTAEVPQNATSEDETSDKSEKMKSDIEEDIVQKKSLKPNRKRKETESKNSSGTNSDAESPQKNTMDKTHTDDSNDEECTEKIPEATDKIEKISSDTESTVDLPINDNNTQSKIVNDDILMEKLQTCDENMEDSPKSPEKNCQDLEDPEEINSVVKNLSFGETSDDERQSHEEDIPTKNNVDDDKNDGDTGKNVSSSMENVIDKVNEDKSESVSKSSSVTDESERRSSLDKVSNEGNDKKITKSGSTSPCPDGIERTSSIDTILYENEDEGVAKSGINSPIPSDSENRLSNEEPDKKNDDEKSSSKSTVINHSGRISSTDTILTDDLEETMNETSPIARSNVSRNSISSNPSESENLQVRDILLMSSNSDESSADDSSVLLNTSTMETGDTPPTPPESDSNGRKSTTNDTANDTNESEKVQTDKPQSVKKKRNKFRIKDNPLLMADKKLNQRCEIRLCKLEKKILDRHSRALKKSRDYVDSKKLKRLLSLDKLDKNKKTAKNSDSEDDDAASSKDSRIKKKTVKEPEETLLDHLKKVKNGENNELSNESDDEGSSKEIQTKNKSDDQSEESMFAEADKMAKKRLLESSDSAGEDSSTAKPEDKEDEEDKDEKTKKKSKKVVKKENSEKSSEDEEKKQDKADKGRWRKNKILTLRISDSDSEEEKKKFQSSQEKMAEKKKNEGSQSESEEERTPKKKRVRRRVLHSDSDAEVSPESESENSDDSIKHKQKKKKNGSDDDGNKKSRKRVRKGDRTSDSSDSLDEKRPKTRRKRIKTADSDSDSDIENSQGTPGKSGRKNIRKVIRDKQVADDTKQAAKDEEERLKRIAERQKLYNEMYETRLAGEAKVDKLVLDFDEKTKEPLVSVDEALVKRLKPHQAQGIKFMWDACFESLERTKTTIGSGCILAHCMGLGKSFQIVALSHTLLTHEETGIKTIMVVCPLSTVLNWVNEFKIWLEDLPNGDDIEIYELTRMKKNFERKYQLQRWQKTGGVLIIGYEMFRNLSNCAKKVRKNIQEAFSKSLVDPGADLIVCDEGHLLKNEDTALSKAMRRVKTLRRIVLTGTPLQNNLIEYHCMVQFVKPNLLGTKKEFTNRFENPITNGQFDDSTEYDVRLMKKRAHVLHKMLEGSVQRLDYSVLTPFLPPKQEYVIFIKLTEIQIKMYRYYLDNYARRHRGVGGSLFADFQALQRIWTHPMVMRMNAEKVERANEKKRLDATDSEGSLRDFIDDGSDSSSSESSDVRSASDSDDNTKKKPKRGTRANPVVEEPALPEVSEKVDDTTIHDEIEWWTQFVKEEDHENMRISSKLLLLFSILKACHSVGDKVLVFSQSLYSLTLIEEFLRMIDDETQRGNEEPENLDKHSGSWSLGLDYFRLDGQTSTDNRRRWCEIFNKPSNTRARLFLISTRAGGLGINLTAANRVIIFDASWNPSHDVQSIFRIYRFGQKKPCYVYRLLAAGTMEEKIYNRQVTKLSLSCRVVDEQQIERHYSNNALAELYKLEISETEKTLNLPKDRLLAEIFLEYKHCVENYHEHDSLLENQAGEELDEEERQQAWLEYEEEKKGKRHLPQVPFPNMTIQNEIFMQQMNLINMAQQNQAITNPAMLLDYENIKQMMSKDYPGVSEAQQKAMATRTVYEMYNYVERQAMAHNPMALMNMGVGQLGYDNRMAQPNPITSHPTPEMIRLYQQSLVQQQNGQMNYPINHGIIGDTMQHARNPAMTQMAQLPPQPSTTTTIVDDDIVEIPSSPEKNSAPPPPAPGGSRKSQEE